MVAIDAAAAAAVVGAIIVVYYSLDGSIWSHLTAITNDSISIINGLIYVYFIYLNEDSKQNEALSEYHHYYYCHNLFEIVCES